MLSVKVKVLMYILLPIFDGAHLTLADSAKTTGIILNTEN